MTLPVPESGCRWNDKKADELGDCYFEVYFCKIDEITNECGGSPRKQTKQETIVEGLNAMHNAQAAANLVGAKFLISRSGAQLHATTLPADVLRKFKLPEEYERAINGDPAAPPAPAPISKGFAGFSNADPIPDVPAGEDKRISLAAKRMFLQLAASLDVIYAHESEDLYIVEVKPKPNPVSIVEAVFDNGEHFNGEDAFNISFGLLKQVEA